MQKELFKRCEDNHIISPINVESEAEYKLSKIKELSDKLTHARKLFNNLIDNFKGILDD